MTPSLRGLAQPIDSTPGANALGGAPLPAPRALNPAGAPLPSRDFSGQLLAIADSAIEPPAALPVEESPAVEGREAHRAQTNAEPQEQHPELSAEQWLLGMLGQQLTLVQVRDPQQVTPATAPALATASGAARLVANAGLSSSAPAGRIPEQPIPAPVATLADGLATQSLPAATASAVPPAAATPEALRELPDSLLAALGEREDATPDVAVGERQAAVPTSPAERTLKLHAPEAKWGEQMLQALREQVELQLSQRSQNATIRLDPPELGSLEILLSHESGRLHVQLSAANADVARLLQQTSERLRQELVGQHFVQVQVQVGADGGQGQGQPRRQPLAQEQVAVAANPHEQTEQATPGKRPRDVLVTV